MKIQFKINRDWGRWSLEQQINFNLLVYTPISVYTLSLCVYRIFLNKVFYYTPRLKKYES